jgi:PAS domain-containing protein
MACDFSICDDPAFRALFSALPCACMVHRMIVDENGEPADYVPLEANPSFARVVGFDPAPILGKRATEYLPDYEARHWAAVFAPVAFEGRMVNVTVYSPRKRQMYLVSAISPERECFLTMYSLARKPRNAVVATNSTVWTDGRCAAGDFIDWMFKTMPCAAALHRIDFDGRGTPVDYTVVKVNTSFCDILGTTPEAMVGINARSRLSGAEVEHWLGVLVPIAVGERKPYAIPILFRSRVAYEGVAVSLETGYVTVIFSD